jgi:hypothetical protein
MQVSLNGHIAARRPQCVEHETDVLQTRADNSPTTTDQRVAAVGLTAKLTAYRPYEHAQPRSHANFLKGLTCIDAPGETPANGLLRSFNPSGADKLSRGCAPPCPPRAARAKLSACA